MSPEVKVFVLPVFAPKPAKGNSFLHPSYGSGYLTSVLGICAYVRFDGRAMPLPFLIRDLKWDGDLKCWTLRKGFEVIEG